VLTGPSVPLEIVQEIAIEKKSDEVCRFQKICWGAEIIATPSISSSEMEDYDAENSRMFSAALIVLQFHLAQKSLQRGEQPHIISPEEMEEGVKIRPLYPKRRIFQ
jgi:hypothetical protein